MFVSSFNKLLQNDHYAYLLAEILCLCCEGWGGTDSALLLGYSTVDGVGIPEVLLGEELHYQLHILLALRISQAVLRPLQSLQQLLQFWERGRDGEGNSAGAIQRNTGAKLYKSGNLYSLEDVNACLLFLLQVYFSDTVHGLWMVVLNLYVQGLHQHLTHWYHTVV